MEVSFTPTQRRLLAVLADGKPHYASELNKCLNDDMAGEGTLKVHMHLLRKKLLLIDETIVAITPGGRRQAQWRHVKLLVPNGKSKTPVDRAG